MYPTHHVHLSKERVEGLKKLTEKHLGIKYTDEQARDAAHKLVNFFYLLTQVNENDMRTRIVSREARREITKL